MRTIHKLTVAAAAAAAMLLTAPLANAAPIDADISVNDFFIEGQANILVNLITNR